MITDDMLSAAAQEVALCMESGICDVPHTFSQGFERKIGRLTRRANHPVLYRVTRAAIAAVLALVMVFGSLMALSPQVRAAVAGWVRSTWNDIFQYSNNQTTPPDAVYEYPLPETFYGYTLLTIIDNGFGDDYIYVNDSGHSLQFIYICGGDDPLFIDVEDCVYEFGYVGNFPADIYISPNPDRNSAVLWEDPDNNILCCLSTRADRELLIEIAETIETFKKEKNLE